MELTSGVVEFVLSLSITTWLFGLLFVLLIVWFNTDKISPECFVERNVKFVRMGNLFWTLLMRRRFELIQDENIRKEGKIFGCSSLGSPIIVCAEPELVGQVFSKHFTTFMNRRKIAFSDPLFENFIFFLENDSWKRCRATLTPTFAMGKIKLMKNTVNETAASLVKNFDDLSQMNELVEIKRVAGAFTMDSIVQIAFGVKLDSLLDEKNPVLYYAKKLFQTNLSLYNLVAMTFALTLPRVAKLLRLRLNGDSMDYFASLSNEIIIKKRASLAANKTNLKPTNFIELLLEAENERLKLEENQETNPDGEQESFKDGKVIKFMTNNEIMAQCIIFFMVGYDTTATTISLTLYNLALNPDVQKRLYEEIIETEKTLQEQSDETDPYKLFTLDVVMKMKLLEACIKETLRLFPPVPIVERRASENVTLQSGDTKVYVKKDDIIAIPIYSIQRHPDLWEDPERYNPDRFLEEPVPYHKYSYIPFGAGPRDCIAKSLAYFEAKMAILHAIRCYKFERAPETQVPVQFYFNTNLVNKEILLRVVRR